MRKLLALLAILAGPALAQQPNGTINAPIYATGYISQVGGTIVTTKIAAQPNHPTNLNIYTTGDISGTWNIQLPNPAFEGQILSFSCGGSAASILITSSDGSTIDSNLPTSCVSASTFAALFDQRSNIWRYIGYSNSASISPGQLPAFVGGDCTTSAGSVALSCYFTFPNAGTQIATKKKIAERLSVLDFGAVGGGADDHVALQAALDWVCKKGGELAIPGAFNTTVPLTCSGGWNGYYRIYGASDYLGTTYGEPSINYTGTSAATAILTTGTNSTVNYGSTIENVVLNGNSHVADALHALVPAHSTFRNIRVRNVTTNCFHFENAIVNTLDRLSCSTNESAGMTTTPITGLLFDGVSGGIIVTGGIGNVILTPVMEGLSGCGISFKTLAAQNVVNAGTSEANGTGICIDGTSNNNTVTGVALEVNTNDVTVSGGNNVFINSSFQSSGTSTIGGSRNRLQNMVIGNIINAGSHNVYDSVYSTGTYTESGVGTQRINWVPSVGSSEGAQLTGSTASLYVDYLGLGNNYSTAANFYMRDASGVIRATVNSNGIQVLAGAIQVASPSVKTAAYTLDSGANIDATIIFSCAASCTATFPSAASWSGRRIRLITRTAQTVVSASSNVVPIVGGATGTAILDATAGKWADLESDGVNWLITAAN